MNEIVKIISSQLKRPRGFLGKIVSLGQNIINSHMYNAASLMVNVSPDEKILDIGFGNGYLLKKIYKKNSADLYGIDMAPDAKLMATKKNKKADRAGKLHLQIGDCCDMPYDENIFSAITTINTIYFWSDTVKGLTEIRRCLKSGKSFYNVVYTKEHLNTMSLTESGYKKFEVNEYIQFGKEAGFEKIEIKEIKKGISMAVVFTK